MIWSCSIAGWFSRAGWAGHFTLDNGTSDWLRWTTEEKWGFGEVCQLRGKPSWVRPERNRRVGIFDVWLVPHNKKGQGANPLLDGPSVESHFHVLLVSACVLRFLRLPPSPKKMTLKIPSLPKLGGGTLWFGVYLCWYQQNPNKGKFKS